MKKRNLILTFIFTILLGLFLVACKGKEPEPPKVIYELDGATWTDTALIEKEPYSKAYNKGERIEEPKNPTKEGKEFVGWFIVYSIVNKDKSVTQKLDPYKFIFSTYKMEDKDITLRAVFK